MRRPIFPHKKVLSPSSSSSCSPHHAHIHAPSSVRMPPEVCGKCASGRATITHSFHRGRTNNNDDEEEEGKGEMGHRRRREMRKKCLHIR